MKSQYQIFKQKVHIVIYGTSTKAGRLFDLILLGLILLSVVLIMMETVTSFDQQYHSELVSLEWIITIFFTIEYLLRIISIQKPWKYIFSFYGIIDLVAILPMYLSIFFLGTSIFSVVRSLAFTPIIQNHQSPTIHKPVRSIKTSHQRKSW